MDDKHKATTRRRRSRKTQSPIENKRISEKIETGKESPLLRFKKSKHLYSLSSSWTKFRREWSTRGRFRAKIRALRREPATRPSSRKSTSALAFSTRRVAPICSTSSPCREPKIQAFVKKFGEKIGQLRLIWQEKLKRLDFLSTDSRSTTANRRLVSAVLFAREWATHDFLRSD